MSKTTQNFIRTIFKIIAIILIYEKVKYFNSIQGWRIENMATAGFPDMPPMPPEEVFQAADNIKTEAEDDLPF